MKNLTCECSDPLCKVHTSLNACTKLATTTLYRIDMEDLTGTLFCDGCANDAYESGLFDVFTEGELDEPEADNDEPSNPLFLAY